MGRKNNSQHKRGTSFGRGMSFRQPRSDSELRADQELRGGRTLKAFRNFEEETAQEIGGALLDLASSGDVPALTTTTKYSVYIFDPRLMPRNYNEGFLDGVKIGRISAQIERNEHIGNDDGYTVLLGKIALMERHRRSVCVEVKSDQLTRERQEFHRVLAGVGVNGFTEAGSVKGRREPRTVLVPIARFEQPLAKENEQDVLSAISETIDFAIGFAASSEVMLGPLQVRTFAPR